MSRQPFSAKGWSQSAFAFGFGATIFAQNGLPSRSAHCARRLVRM